MDPNALRAALPDVRSTLRVRGLEAQLEIFRDRLGIPHVRAQTTLDAFFGQGFVHAQDRLFQMEYDRRRAAGRAAEWIGEPAVDEDVFMRKVRLIDAAVADHDLLDGETKAMCEAYAAGVNAFIETGALPVELTLLGDTPTPWRAFDAGTVMKIRHILMGTMGIKLWRARLAWALGGEAVLSLGSGSGRKDLLIVPPGGEAVWDAADDDLGPGLDLIDGSNNWGLHGSRTASGLPIIAGDPHRTLEAPNVYYQNHIACPDFDVVGLSIPGVPGFSHFGHNNSVAWCITHAMADTQDLYVEQFDDAGAHRVGDAWQPSRGTHEVVHVRGGVPVSFEAVETSNGPVVFGDPARGVALSLRWTGVDKPNRALRTVRSMLTATSIDELDDSMRDWVDPVNSFVMADVHGTLGYLHRGRVPVRNRANGWLPVPGWTGAHGWTGDVPFEELPRMRDPEGGRIVTANNRIVAPDYPYQLSLDYGPRNRAQRVSDRLEQIEAATIDDMQAIHGDVASIAASWYTRLIAQTSPTEAGARTIRDLLAGWDGSMDRASPAAAAYVTMRDELTRVVLVHEPISKLVPEQLHGEPDARPLETRVRGAMARILTEERYLGSKADAVLEEAMERAAAVLAERLGDEPASWRYDAIHLTHTTHPLSGLFPDVGLDPEQVSLGGDVDTVLATGAETGVGVEHASCARYVFDLADRDASRWVVPLGASGHPGSAHYQDQARTWADVGLFPIVSAWPAVEATAVTRQVLEPT